MRLPGPSPTFRPTFVCPVAAAGHAAVATALAAATLLTACATAPSGGDVLAPPPALALDGVPPVPASLAERIGRYAQFKGAGLADWSPDGRRLLVSYLAGPADAQRTQLHEVAAAGAPRRRITDAAEPTRSGRYLPADADLLVFERDAGGSEATRVYRRNLATGEETALTEAGQRCDAGPFDRAGRALVATCVAVDRSAGGNLERSGGVVSTLWWIDVASGARRQLAALPGPGWAPADVSADGRRLLVNRYRSASSAEVWQLDLASGARERLLPRGEAPQFVLARAWLADDRRLLVVSDHAGEFRRAWRYDPATQRYEALVAQPQGDVGGGDLTPDRRRAALIVDVGGVGVLRVVDTETLAVLPVAVPAGVSVTRAQLAPDGGRVAYAATLARAPSEVRVLDLGEQRDVLWAAADTAGLDTAAFMPIERIEWTSFDGRAISGLIQRPPGTFAGRRPVLIDIHGGPEGQARLGFTGRYNYVVNEMGVAFIQPNVRGSTGFGKTFHQLDNGPLREDAVRDIGALLDWIAQQPDLDAGRVVVQGGSYGGYMTNAVAFHYSDRLRGAIPSVGISDFTTFLERTESYRRDLRRAEYGDERDPAMRVFFRAISPLANADRIRVPMFIVHGRNDPRVPVQEAEQIAAIVRRNGVPVWTMIAENEGHGFAKKENADYLFAARVLFLQQYLLGR